MRLYYRARDIDDLVCRIIKYRGGHATFQEIDLVAVEMGYHFTIPRLWWRLYQMRKQGRLRSYPAFKSYGCDDHDIANYYTVCQPFNIMENPACDESSPNP